eukprot:TRINITY_DN5661_c0_g2_i1.p1 TRINITY_DN5661_c0_g2~~TRINITY_DN5661_c0_g2_i1.p1  ORF type:complete len:514 (-),score=156.55 TRINITY_DN5661_c0_g2_i1:119-1660(-)
MSGLEVDSGDVVKVILQYFKENNLMGSLKTLQEETGVSLNNVPSIDTFVSDVKAGRWAGILKQVENMSIPLDKLLDLFEQITLEMIEMREIDTAEALLKNSAPLQLMKKEHPERYLHLDRMLNRGFFDAKEAYPDGSTRDFRRKEIAAALKEEVVVVPPSRLLVLIGQALKWQQARGQIPPEGFDLFQGTAAKRKEIAEKPPKKQHGRIKFSDKSHAEVATFAPDGLSLVSGSVDGFMEVWDYESCSLRKDLQYQAEDKLMFHNDCVLSIAFSQDCELVAAGLQNGEIKVWRLATGQCLRKLKSAHTEGVTSLAFNLDGTQLLSTSFDRTARIHGLRSKRTLKVFSGHESFVNSAFYSPDGTRIVTACSDGFVRVFDHKTTELISKYRPTQLGFVTDVPLHTICPIPNNSEQFVVCGRSHFLHIMNYDGQIVQTFSSGKKDEGAFVACCVSPRGNWIYCVGEDKILYCFSMKTKQLEQVLTVSESEVIGIAHHPMQNIIVIYTAEGEMVLWKS